MTQTKYSDLPEWVREFLEGLSKAEVDDLTKAVALYRSIKTVGVFTKWLIISIIGAFVGMASFGEAVMKLLGLAKGFGR